MNNSAVSKKQCECTQHYHKHSDKCSHGCCENSNESSVEVNCNNHTCSHSDSDTFEDDSGEEHHKSCKETHCSCGCGHNHGSMNVDIKCNCGSCSEHSDEEKNSLLSKIILGVSAVIIFTMLIFNLAANISPIVSGIACGIATILVGYETFLKGLKSLVKLKINETTLMTIAVIAAFCLGEYIEGALVTLLFQFGEFMEDIAVNRSRKSIEKLAQIRPDTALLLTDKGEKEVPVETVEVGSTVIIKPHERIPLDGVIVEGTTFIDTSAITGESIPMEGTACISVMSGMQNGEGIIKVKTTKTANDSAASRILKMVENSQKNKGSSEKFITRFAKVYTPIVMVIAILVAFVPLLFGGVFSDWIYRALVCLVASCPCAVVISVPLAYFAGIGGASKNGIMIKGGKYVEAISQADCFVFDKTGTLTTGDITVSDITCYGEMNEKEILKYCASAEQYSTHPIAQAIKNKATNEKIKLSETHDNKEKAGFGVTAVIDGKKYTVGNIKLLNQEDRELIKNDNSIFLLVDGKLQGGISVQDAIRKETKNVLARLKSMGVKELVMLTGDDRKKAENLAVQAGITKIHSNLLPEQKVSYMREIKENHKSTIFVGDGINDAPVIALADCGIAMGLGSEAAIEASDAVLSDGSLRQLPTMKKIARKIMNTIKADITLSLLVKTAVIALAIVGIAPMWLGVLSDTGLTMLCVLYTMRLIKYRNK